MDIITIEYLNINGGMNSYYGGDLVIIKGVISFESTEIKPSLICSIKKDSEHYISSIKTLEVDTVSWLFFNKTVFLKTPEYKLVRYFTVKMADGSTYKTITHPITGEAIE